jgi:hypothetical protein
MTWKFSAGSPRRHPAADRRSAANGTISVMSTQLTTPARAAGYVVLTSMAAGLELIRNGWTEVRADPATAETTDPADEAEPAPTA